MNDPHLLIDIHDGIGWITVNRPVQLNALNAEILHALRAAMESLGANAEVRVVVLTGAGEKAFIAGADIRAMQAMDAEAARAFCRLGHACMSNIAALPKPVIAMVNGFALGGGLETALACDWIVAVEHAQFGLPEVTLGLFPGFGGTQRLRHAVGKARAMELIFTGRRLTAREAHAWGLVNTVVPAAELRNTVLDVARAIMANSPAAIRLAKRALLQGLNMGLSDGLHYEEEQFPKCFERDDCVEGLTAFVEKRRPVFTGK
ncbi:MAG: enoyl-CoA hydratase/isomerase family protein [Deltaproteobacteria bacterium]|nr:enoyl-CoA hydratase/isomerase family protein [Deltaproteobacteria bacterium]